MDRIARVLGEPILSDEPLSGGCISNARRVRTRDGTYLCKLSDSATNLFLEEAEGLDRISATETIRCPKVIHRDSHFLILEWIDSETEGPDFWRSFGRQLASLHRIPQGFYGFELDNHIGLTPQANPLRAAGEISWTDYFIEYRLKPMLHHRQIAVDSLLQALYAKAEARIRLELDKVSEPPSLVHGDLWGGNFLCAEGQNPVLIDPAPYYGHREVDLAMAELFGGFDSEFYRSYQQAYPLESGFEVRKRIYNLYHMLNHWILFGSSYREPSCALLRSL